MRLDVYENRNPKSRDRLPYLLDVQVELLSALETRVVIPLARESSFAGKSIIRLMPVIEVDGEDYVVLTPQIAAIARRELGSPVCSVGESRADVTAALDLLFTGI